MFLVALSDYLEYPDKITIVLKGEDKLPDDLSCRIPLHTVVRVLEKATESYPLQNDRTTYFVCSGKICKPPVNELEDMQKEEGSNFSNL